VLLRAAFRVWRGWTFREVLYLSHSGETVKWDGYVT
jgi:hypothetical protein